MKQTAVEWLAIEYNRIDNKWKNVGQGQKHCDTEKAEALKQAKAMEKEQMFDYIKKNYVNGENSLKFHQEEFEKYHNETFKSK